MSSKRKFLLVFIFVVLDVFLVIGFLEVRESTMLNYLRREMSTLNQLNMATDRYNLKIKTKGDYAIVEKTIKEYLDETAVLLQDTLQITQDSKFMKVLTYDHYEEDGPDFEESIAYLEKKKEEFNQNMDSLLNRLEEENIKNYIHTKTKNSYLCNLYDELILNDTMKGDLEETSNLVLKSKERINHLLDTSTSLLKFLVSNKDSWVLEEGEIRFKTESLYQKYIQYVNQVKE